MVHLFMLPLCARAMAEDIDGRRKPQRLAAGVSEATEEGVKFGVGRGSMRGARSGLGSRNRGNASDGVGVLSCDVEASRMGLGVCFEAVGVAGEESSTPPTCSKSGAMMLSINGMLSSSGDMRGTMRFQLEFAEGKPEPGDGGGFGE